MKTLLIEDEALAANRLRKLLKELEPGMDMLGHTDSIESSVAWLQANEHPELIFMDIELADGQSFEIFNRIEVKSHIIFTTAYDEFALRAFQVNSIDYLLKPIQTEDLQRALNKYKGMVGSTQPGNTFDFKYLIAALKGNQYKDRFLVKQGQKFIPVEATEIAYFYTEEKVSFIKTISDQRYMIDFSLDELENFLDPKCFFRANRQVIVSPRALEGIHNHFNGKLKIQLRPYLNDEVFVSREKAADFKLWLGE